MTFVSSGRVPFDKAGRGKALQVVLLFGLISLFGDLAYEGARSVNGPYLKLLAANAAMVGLIAGVGELLGYALRLLSGYLSDKTRNYWLFTFLGYGLIVFVPLLSFAGIWQVAAIFIVMERIGKAVRNPSRDVILSSASREVGTGFAFGLHEAMDQVGAIAGPLIFVAVFAGGSVSRGLGDYQRGYHFLWVPFVLLMVCVYLVYRRVPRPDEFERSSEASKASEKFPRVFWIYTLFTFVTTLGFINFILAGYHFKATGVLTDAQIPLFYALAMLTDGIAAYMIGRMYDRLKSKRKSESAGLDLLIAIPVLSLVTPIALFSRNILICLAGALVWGVVLGIHETIMRAAIADIVHLKKRGMGYGIFNSTYGVSMFLGSVLFGLLYDRSLHLLIIASVVLQCSAIAVFFRMRREVRGA
jgi:MFS family permease